jgi:cyclohexanone monooxygenase
MSPSVLANMPTAIEQHVDWIAQCLSHMREERLGVIEAREDAQEAWVSHTRDVANATLYPKANSWYFGSNVPGKPRIFAVYMGGFNNYSEKCNTVAANGYEGFEFATARPSA